MRIVQFIDTLRSGGKERQLVELLKGLTEMEDVKVHLLIMSNNIHYSALSEIDVQVHYLLRNSRHDPSIYLKVFTLLREIKPDILHSWNSMCSIYALPAVKLLKITFINGFLRNSPNTIPVLSENWLRSRITFPFSDAIVANSNAGLTTYKAPRAKSRCIRNGFDTARLQGLSAAKEVREKYAIQTRFVVGMVASFNQNKDYIAFIEAGLKVLQHNGEVTFVAVGSGQNYQQIKEMVPEEFSEFFKFTGKISDVEDLVQLFDIGVLFSTNGEGISNTIMEYMALEKPVIATDCAGNCELVLDGETGYLIPDNSVAEIEKRVTELLANKTLRQRLGANGKNRICDHFNLDKLVEQHLELYEAAMDSV